MATYFNTFEGGTNTDNITEANSGGASGDAWTFKSVPANTTITYDTGSALFGSMGMRINSTAATLAPYLQKDVTAANRYVIRTYFRFPSLPGTTVPLYSFRNTSTNNVAMVQTTSANKLQLYNAAGTGMGAGATTGTVLSANTWYRSECGVNGVSGAWDFALFNTAGTTLDSLSGTEASFGAVQIDRLRLGRVQNTGGSFTGVTNFDSFKAQDLNSGFIGADSSTPPTLVMVNGLRYLVDARTSTAGAGGALSYDIVQTSGPTTAPTLIVAGVWKVTPDAAATLEYDVTVSEVGGSSDTSSVSIPPVTAGGGAEKIYLGAGPGWS